MSDAIRTSRRYSFNQETLRFLLVGCTTVAIDYLTYQLLVSTGFQLSLAKGLSFVSGAVFAFFANRAVTFRVEGKPSAGQFFRFALLYVTTLGLNVLCNRVALNILPQIFPKLQIQLAFLFATGVSTVANFLGLKYIVFSKTRNQVDCQ